MAKGIGKVKLSEPQSCRGPKGTQAPVDFSYLVKEVTTGMDGDRLDTKFFCGNLTGQKCLDGETCRVAHEVKHALTGVKLK